MIRKLLGSLLGSASPSTYLFWSESLIPILALHRHLRHDPTHLENARVQTTRQGLLDQFATAAVSWDRPGTGERLGIAVHGADEAFVVNRALKVQYPFCLDLPWRGEGVWSPPLPQAPQWVRRVWWNGDEDDE